MPYYFPKPIQQKFVRYVLVHEGPEVDISKYTWKVIRDFLASVGEMNPVKDCLHENIYFGGKIVCCWDCGFTWESRDEAEQAQRLKMGKGEER